MTPRPFPEELLFNQLIIPAQMDYFALVCFSSQAMGAHPFPSRNQQVGFNNVRFKAASTTCKINTKCLRVNTLTLSVQVSRNFWWGSLAPIGFILDL